MINSVTAENSFANPRTLDSIVYYIQSKPDRWLHCGLSGLCESAHCSTCCIET